VMFLEEEVDVFRYCKNGYLLNLCLTASLGSFNKENI